MDISFDPKKREAALVERGLDFRDAAEVFEAAVVMEYEDTRHDYAYNHRRVSARTHGRDLLDTARHGPPRYLDEESQ